MALAGMPVDEGIRAGVERASRFGLSAPDEVEESAQGLTRAAIEQANVVLSEGGTTFFAEFVAVSAIARHASGDPELTIDQLVPYLNSTIDVGNCFFHA